MSAQQNMADFMTKQFSVVDAMVIDIRVLLTEHPEPIATAYLMQVLDRSPERLLCVATAALILLAKQPTPDVTP